MRSRRPAGGFKPAHLVDRIGKRQRPVDRDPVVVEQHDQLAKLEVAGEGNRFLAYSLHEIAVGDEHVGMVVDDLLAEDRGEMPLGDGHADGVAKPLPEGPGGGLHARRDEILRMSRGKRAELAESLDLLDLIFS